ncbi:WD40 repeat-like protein [Phellopilus nigrolimitatus]|nr:WD40 repeat-like protein [Phellopilus nigrolimitatus]
MSKREASPPPSGVLVKRARGSTPEMQIAISSAGDASKQGLVRTVKRTSGLEAPIVSLAGAHTAEIMSCRFDPSGQNVAACSADRSVSLWRTYPPTSNYGHLTTLHKAPVLDLQWSLFAPLLYTLRGRLPALHGPPTGVRARRVRAHRGVVNALDRTLAAARASSSSRRARTTGACTCGRAATTARRAPSRRSSRLPRHGRLLERGRRDAVRGRAGQRDPVRLRPAQGPRGVRAHGAHGHADVAGALAERALLLSPSFASQTLIHDVRPFSPSPSRVHRTLLGAPAGFEHTLLRAAWSRDDGGGRVAVGGADRMVCIWDVESAKILYKLPGHKGTVTAVDFHPKEPIILTGSKDATMLLGELEPGLAV